MFSVSKSKTIVVTGATGLQGGAVARQLLQDGWHVRALTRKPRSKRAAALAPLGAEVVQGDMENPGSLHPAFAGAYGVYSVQNPVLSGVEAEIRQGRNVADVAHQTGVHHLIYASAGLGIKGTGVPSWESKLQVEDHLRGLGIPLTILRPMAFMELMTEKKFYPSISTWHVMPKLMGSARKVAWLCVDDLGAIAARIFAQPARFIGKDLKLASDFQSIDECRVIYRDTLGNNPPRMPIPIWLFERFGFVGADLSLMWRWLRTASFEEATDETRTLHPEPLSVRDWLSQRKALQVPAH